MIFTDTERAWLRSEGVPRQVITYWESDESIRPGPKYAPIVAKVMRKSLEWVLYGDCMKQTGGSKKDCATG